MSALKNINDVTDCVWSQKGTKANSKYNRPTKLIDIIHLNSILYVYTLFEIQRSATLVKSNIITNHFYWS